MKRFFAFALLSIFIACKKEQASTVPAMDAATPNAAELATGRFENGPYGTVTGLTKVLRNTSNEYELVLDSFATNNGPDLYVYLSKEKMPVNFIEAGKLKSVSGRQVYPLSARPDLTAYKYLCIHCKAYNHLFGWALLQ